VLARRTLARKSVRRPTRWRWRRRPFDEPITPPGAVKNAAPGGVSALQ